MHRLFVLLLSCVAFLVVWALMPAPSWAAQPFAMPSGATQADPSASTPASPPALTSDERAGPASRLYTSLLVRAMRIQQSYFRGLAKAFRAFDLQRSWAAASALISLSFAYGIFHAIGPGHGKVVVTSYLLADERDVKRGVLLAFMGATMQAVTAIVMVGALAILLGLTHRAVADAVPIVERLSFALVAGLGVLLLWRALKPDHGHHHDGHEHHHDHKHAGHAHLPGPDTLRKTQNWRDMAALVLAVGLRPCTGAILVLLFAVTQGAFMVGALSSLAMSVGTAITVSTLAVLTLVSKNVAFRVVGTADNRWTNRIERGLKITGGFFILVVGLLLLASSFMTPAQPLL